MPSEIVPSDVVKAIQGSVAVETIEVLDNQFVSRHVFLPPAEPKPETLELNTLTGLIEYVKNGADSEFMEDGRMIHVVDPFTVSLVSGLFGRFEQRKVYATANAPSLDFNFGYFYDAETFNIKFQSLFVDAEDRDNVLRVVGNIKEENVRQTGDDGVTQSVTAKSGIARVEEVPVPNPVTLIPFRTFREVAQPSSLFILRLRQGREGQMPTCALFEADGGQWKRQAIESIAEYLRTQTEGVTIIA